MFTLVCASSGRCMENCDKSVTTENQRISISFKSCKYWQMLSWFDPQASSLVKLSGARACSDKRLHGTWDAICPRDARAPWRIKKCKMTVTWWNSDQLRRYRFISSLRMIPHRMELWFTLIWRVQGGDFLQYTLIPSDTYTHTIWYLYPHFVVWFPHFLARCSQWLAQQTKARESFSQGEGGEGRFQTHGGEVRVARHLAFALWMLRIWWENLFC